MCPVFPSLLPLPLVTLKLTTGNILDTILIDAQDATPLFSVETQDDRTTVYMYNQRRGLDNSWTRGQVAEVAAIQWPAPRHGAIKKQSPFVTILGETQPASSFFKKSLLGGSRKFYVEGQQHPLRWKHVGEHYECTLCSHACTAHRAVATFEPAHTTSAARLAIYTSTVTNALPTSEYNGVDMDMMVYLILTAILLSAPHPSPMVAPMSPKSMCQQPSPISSMGNYKIDLLAPDEAFVPSHPSPLRSRGSPSSSSSCYSSLPASPISPATDLSPINNETFASGSSGSSVSRSSSVLVGRRQSTRHSTPHAGPNSITPYHLPPTPTHSSPVHSSPPALRLQVPSPMHSHSPSPRINTPISNNALLLDTSMPLIYTSELHNIQFSQSPASTYTSSHITPIPQPPREELPPAYNEIEWTVRVKQPRQTSTALAY